MDWLFPRSDDPRFDRARDVGLLLLRVGIASMMLVHGLGKLENFAELRATFADPLGVGTTTSLVLALLGEVGASLFLIAGLLTRVMAVPFSTTMIVAGFLVHAHDPWGRKEMAMLYLLVGVVIALVGPGRFSLDALIAARRR